MFYASINPEKILKIVLTKDSSSFEEYGPCVYGRVTPDHASNITMERRFRIRVIRKMGVNRHLSALKEEKLSTEGISSEDVDSVTLLN